MTEEMDIVRMTNDLMHLYREGRHAEALDIADRMAERFPDRPARTAYYRACLLTRLGRPDEAMATLGDGIRGGSWWFPEWLLNDPDLEPLRSRRGFGDIVATSRARRAASGWKNRRPPLLRFDPPRRRAALVALHMHGVSAETSAPWWRSASELGVAVAVPESTQRTADGEPCWEDQDRTEQDVARAIELIGTVDGPLILGGGSAGAGWAIRFALRGHPARPGVHRRGPRGPGPR